MSEREFARALKEMRERKGATQGQVAQAVKVSRPTIAQWEAGRHLPSPERAVVLDEYLRANGELARIVELERRETQATVATSPDPGAPRTDLLTVFRKVEAALLDGEHLIRDEGGQLSGWRHHMQRVRGLPTPIATAYGIRSVLLLEGARAADLAPLAQRLRDQAEPDGGWAASGQTRSRPEATAAVVDAIARLGSTTDFSRLVGLLDETLDEVSWQHPFVMATVLETVLDLRPVSDLASRLMRGLLDTRRPSVVDAAKVWSQKNEPGLASPEPSAVHTARAVCALARARSMGVVADDLVGEVDDALGIAVDWLLRRARIENITEELRRTGDASADRLTVRHFTPAHVARALVLAGISAGHPVVVDALGRVWDYFDEERSLWRWSTGDLPVWMTFDAVAALRLAALAAFPGPESRPDIRAP